MIMPWNVLPATTKRAIRGQTVVREWGFFNDLLTQIASFTSALLSNALVCNLRCNKMGLQTGFYQLDPRGTKFFLLTTYLEGLAERGVNLQLFFDVNLQLEFKKGSSCT